MDRVVVSVDGTAASRAAVEWCAHHLRPGVSVIAVCGVSFLGEFALGLPPFETSASGIGDCADTIWCEPLRAAGLRCTPRLVHRRQVSALAEVTRREHADLLVIGRQSRHGLADIVIGNGFDRLVHRPPCPLVIVPATDQRGAATTQPDAGSVGSAGRSASPPLDPFPARAEADLPLNWCAALAADDHADDVRVVSSQGVSKLGRLMSSNEADVVVVDQPDHGSLSGLANFVGGGRLLRLIDSARCPVVILPTARQSASSPKQSPMVSGPLAAARTHAGSGGSPGPSVSSGGA